MLMAMVTGWVGFGRPLTLYYSVSDAILWIMPTKIVTFRAPEEKISSLDAIAALQQRDRSFILNEAVDQYLSLQEYHRGLIEEGLRQSETEEGIPHEEVVAMLEDLSQKLRKKHGLSKKRA
jgi:RHH-type rel operon transcriptional repressor/antitoxin RelB